MINDSRILIAEERKDIGTGSARALRRSHRIPAVIYGPGRQTISISLEEKEVIKYYKQPSFSSSVIEIQMGDVTHKVIPQAVEVHPVKDLVRHVDFVFLSEKTQNVKVPIIYKNKTTAIGVKRGGFFNIVVRKVLLECNVDSIPKNIELDVSGARIGHSIKASKLVLPEGVKLAVSNDLILASITGRGKDDEPEDKPSAPSAEASKAKK
jgi:large subunit ribosomal protein L25